MIDDSHGYVYLTIYIYIEGDVEIEGSPPPAEKRRVRVGINRITQDTMEV
jgi:hypothetical protein